MDSGMQSLLNKWSFLGDLPRKTKFHILFNDLWFWGIRKCQRDLQLKLIYWRYLVQEKILELRPTHKTLYENSSVDTHAYLDLDTGWVILFFSHQGRESIKLIIKNGFMETEFSKEKRDYGVRYVEFNMPYWLQDKFGDGLIMKKLRTLFSEDEPIRIKYNLSRLQAPNYQVNVSFYPEEAISGRSSYIGHTFMGSDYLYRILP